MYQSLTLCLTGLVAFVASQDTTNAAVPQSTSWLNQQLCNLKLMISQEHFMSDSHCSLTMDNHSAWTMALSDSEITEPTDNSVGTASEIVWYAEGSSQEVLRKASLKLPTREPMNLLLDYEPTEKDVFRDFDGSSDYTMLIYGNVVLREREQKQLEEFDDWLTENGLSIPFGHDDFNNRQDIRILINEPDMPFQDVYNSLQVIDEFQRHGLVDAIDDYETKLLPFLQKGTVYLLGHDKHNCPILVVNQRKAFDSGMTIKTIMDACDLLGAWAMAHAWVPGKAETMTIIHDIKGVSFFEFPILAAKEPVAHNSLVWRQRLGHLYVVNAPMYMRVGLQMISNFMKPDTRFKIQILGGKNDMRAAMASVMDLNQLEKKFGGTYPTKKDDFWPPNLNI